MCVPTGEVCDVGQEVATVGEIFRRKVRVCTACDLRLDTTAARRRCEAQGASNATINRDLITLKRMLTLAVQGGKLTAKPYVPLLKERNVRRGFFEPEQFQRVKAGLPRHMQGIAAFACITSWRTPSEILPLEWAQVDMQAGEVRLEPGATKNEEGRVFPFTTELRKILEGQQQIAEELRAKGIDTRFVFCHTVGEKAGQRISESAYIQQ